MSLLQPLVERANLERAKSRARVLPHDRDGMIHVVRHQHAKAAELLLGFSKRSVGHQQLPVTASQRLGFLGGGQPLSAIGPEFFAVSSSSYARQASIIADCSAGGIVWNWVSL